jgi:hypothetical protein
MEEANKWLATYSRFWQMQLDSLEEYLTTTEGEENDTDKKRTTNTGSKKGNKRTGRKGV